MNFDRQENPLSQDSEQDFNIPQQSFYAPTKQNPVVLDSPERQEIVEPFVVSSVEEEPNEEPHNFEEREIANWQAQDIIIGEKNKTWYVIFGVVVFVLVAVAIYLQMWTFIALILAAATAVLMTRRDSHANIISYSLSTRGIYIGNDFYPYSDFKAFGVLREANVYSMVFLPKKRFSPSTTIYFQKEDGEKITDIVGQRLPMEDIKFDIIDRIVRKIKL